MLALLHQFLAICLLRAGPQDLPVHPRLPIGLAGAYVLVGGMVLASQLSFAEGAAQAGLDALLLAAFVWGVLRFRGFPERFIQTYAALLGVNLLLTLLSWPLFAMAPLDPASTRLSAAQVGLLLVLLWTLIAQGQIWRSALEVGAGLGLLLAFAYFMVASLIIAAVFPAAAPA
ncbi:MAG: hypothetical protein ABWU16_08220 [Halothiobacillaceae bacterium]